MVSHRQILIAIFYTLVFYNLILQSSDAIGEERTRWSCYNNCDSKNYPYIVSIGIEDPYKFIGDTKLSVCSGTMLSKLWVITLSKCVHKADPTLQIVQAGASFDVYNAENLDFFTQTYGEKRKIQKTKVVEGHIYGDTVSYKTDPLCDLGLLKVKKPFTLTWMIKTVKMPTSELVTLQCINLGQKVVAVGFGDNFDYTIYPEKDKSCRCMRCSELMLDPSTGNCVTTWLKHKYTIDGTVFCATKNEEPNGVYAGDDGGPVLCDGNFIGVVALHRQDEDGLEPAVAFTAVSKFYTFISKTTGMRLGFESAPRPLTGYG